MIQNHIILVIFGVVIDRFDNMSFEGQGQYEIEIGKIGANFTKLFSFDPIESIYYLIEVVHVFCDTDQSSGSSFRIKTSRSDDADYSVG